MEMRISSFPMTEEANLLLHNFRVKHLKNSNEINNFLGFVSDLGLFPLVSGSGRWNVTGYHK